MSTFITNNGQKDLKSVLNLLVTASSELKFLVGFFYFSGISELYESLKQNPEVSLKILVGLNVDIYNHRLIETDYESLKDSDIIDSFFGSIKNSFTGENFDNQSFYEQVQFFVEKLKSKKLQIRKTEKPNHAKLYLFRASSDQGYSNSCLITGSSNLTRAGLSSQPEFNVQIMDYGFPEAEQYFEDLWLTAIKITEDDVRKMKLIEVIENDTLVRSISPYEAYCYIIKCYAESYGKRKSDDRIPILLKKNDYLVYSYQIDAIEQALSIIEINRGVLIADVVGLGKSIIAACIGNSLGKRGLIICPPGLIGDDNKTQGWSKYKEEFELYGWEIRSSGDLSNVVKFLKANPDKFEVVIVDEVHKFRNQDTENYELLMNICRNKIVILLTATPFNNSPADILSLLKLFIAPKKSTITLDDNLEKKFSRLEYDFQRLSFIVKNFNSKDPDKKAKAERYYKDYFGSDVIILSYVKMYIQTIAKEIRDIVEPVTIRRNRLDLTTHNIYKNEIKDLSKVKNPEEYFFELTKEQSEFYDLIIQSYFAEPESGGRFNGAIYRPFEYDEGIVGKSYDEIEKLQKDKNRELIQQRNLFDIMRRMIVKRFESSFGAFEQTINNFINIYDKVLRFISKRGNGNPLKGEYILDRKLLEKIVDIMDDEDNTSSVERLIDEYVQKIEQGVYPKSHKIYEVSKFKQKELFIEHINSDIAMLEEILDKLNDYKLIDNDPKSKAVFEKFDSIFSATRNIHEPIRKILIFSEYADTVKFITEKLKSFKSKQNYSGRTLTVHGTISKATRDIIENNFNASAKNPSDDYDIIITTDKLSEGFNLNRAGIVINYDIPWNPVRVIQRVGRINRIGKKVFDELMIANLFPTEKGADKVRSREIAANKMFMIHNTLGEDTKIFNADEEPTPSKMYDKIKQNPDDNHEINIYTKISNLYEELKLRSPEVFAKLDNMPPRIKTGKIFNDDEMLLFVKKNRMYVKSFKKVDGKIESNVPLLEDVIEKIICLPETPAIAIDEEFWEIYETAKMFKDDKANPIKEISIENKALQNLRLLINYKSNIPNSTLNFMKSLREDITDYGTLPDFTLRRIANLDTDNIHDCIEVINQICKDIGSDHLDKIRIIRNTVDREIIIAYMNRTNEKEIR